MSIFSKMGAEAAEATNDNSNGKNSPIVPFKNGSEYRVVVRSINDVAEYYGYGIFGKVNTFVPEKPAERNRNGYVTGNPSVWDQAADLIYADARAAKDAGNAALDEELRKEARLYRGSKRNLRAFYDLTTKRYIVVDLSSAQEAVVKDTIAENAEDLGELAFKLTKKGSGTGTIVSLSPILKVTRDLSADEQAALSGVDSVKPFELSEFETCLFVANREEQTKNLVIAGFDIGRLGLSIGANTAAEPEAPPIDESAPVPDTALF
ncbi:hypothetical protein [Paenibacillus pinihumi]|uniref:hypothetical protein n=1 Tax=Paenibacillus pinihumi TaxID=669462 RepID=UPI000403E4A9|nr:hypothetical protein [Paenibacillus pinihumi]